MNSVSDLLLGKVPPQTIEIEEAILGALIIERDAILKLDLVPEVFYKEEHRTIYKAVEALNREGRNIDLTTVMMRLKDTGKLEEVGGVSYLAQLTRNVASAIHIEQHTVFLLQAYIRRELIRISTTILEMAYDTSNDIDDILQLYESAITSIDNIILGKKKGREIRAVLKDLTDEVERRVRISKTGGLTGITTGFGELNRITSGWQPNWLVVFAARPAMGKTALAINRFAKVAAQNGHWVNIFSLEMEDISLTERLVLGASGIDPYNLRSGQMTTEDWDNYNRSVAELQDLPIFIDDTPYVRISHIRNVARMNRRQNKCDMVIIDYLQLANAGGNDRMNREQQVAEMSRQLKALAKELQIPIILLSQLSRDVEKRGGTKRPNMSDLIESGAIEQDADLIIFPWRPIYYGIEPEVDDPKHYGELILSKNRHGRTGDIKFWHNDNMTDFSDMPFSNERSDPSPDRYLVPNYYFDEEDDPF